MSAKIAVAIVHGICVGSKFDEEDNSKYTQGMARALKLKLADLAGREESEDEKLRWADSKLAISAINWTPVLREERKNLYQRLGVNRLDSFFGLREFVFQAIADSLTYQVTQAKVDDLWGYDGIHSCFADSLHQLVQQEMVERDAPLCIICHSLGTVITSNYIYDLQTQKSQINIGNTPLEKGETLASIYTLASQIPFWSLRHPNFDRPIKVPAENLSSYYPELQGEWINFFNKSDVMGYPLKSLNDAYDRAVTEDKEVNDGGLLESWNPLSHCSYWTSESVVETIANGLYGILQQINKTDWVE